MGLLDLFFSKKWIVIWSIDGQWNIVDDFDTKKLIDIKKCNYIIEFCEKNDEFRLITEGYNPKQHNLYNEAITKLSDYQIGRISIDFTEPYNNINTKYNDIV